MSALEKQIEGLLDRIMDSTKATVIAAYEKRIEDMEHKKQVLEEKLHQKGKPKHDFDKMFKLSMQFLANPCKIWDTGNLLLRRTLLKIAFTERMSYNRKTGVQTPQVSVPFEFLENFNPKCEMVQLIRTT